MYVMYATYTSYVYTLRVVGICEWVHLGEMPSTSGERSFDKDESHYVTSECGFFTNYAPMHRRSVSACYRAIVPTMHALVITPTRG